MTTRTNLEHLIGEILGQARSSIDNYGQPDASDPLVRGLMELNNWVYWRTQTELWPLGEGAENDRLAALWAYTRTQAWVGVIGTAPLIAAPDWIPAIRRVEAYLRRNWGMHDPDKYTGLEPL